MAVNSVLRIAVSATLIATAFSSMAAEFDYQGNLGIGHSDNIRRASSNEKGEEIASAGVRFSLSERGKRLQADAVGDLSYVDYLGNTYKSDVLGNFVGNVAYALVPERLVWMAADNFGQVLSDPFAPVTPDNRQNINYFTTGPDLTMAFGPQTRLRMGGRYSLTTYERDPFDSDSVSGQVALLRQLSSSSNLSLNARYQQVSYDQSALNADYDQSDAFIRYDASGARTNIAVDAGYSRIKRDAAADSESGLLLRLDASRRLSSSSTATLAVGREFANAGSAFAQGQNLGPIGQQPTQGLQTVEPFTHDYITLGYDFRRNRTALGVFGSWDKRSYDGASTLDQTLTSLGASVTREMSPRTSLTVDASYTRAKFDVPNGDYNDWSAGVSYAWRLTERVTVSATYDHFSRSGDRADADYHENRFWLSIGYGRGRPRNVLAPPAFSIDQRT